MNKIIKKQETRKTQMVKLLKYVQGQWRIVDYGVKSKINTYTALGFIVINN